MLLFSTYKHIMEGQVGEIRLDMRSTAFANGENARRPRRGSVVKDSEDIASSHTQGNQQGVLVKRNRTEVRRRRAGRLLLLVAGTAFAAALLIFQSICHLNVRRSARGLSTAGREKGAKGQPKYCRLGTREEYGMAGGAVMESEDAELHAKALAVMRSFVAFTKASEHALRGSSDEVKRNTVCFLVSLFVQELTASVLFPESAPADSEHTFRLPCTTNSEAMRTSKQSSPDSDPNSHTRWETEVAADPVLDSDSMSELEVRDQFSDQLSLFYISEPPPGLSSESLTPSATPQNNPWHRLESSSSQRMEPHPVAPLNTTALSNARRSGEPSSDSYSLAHGEAWRNIWSSSKPGSSSVSSAAEGITTVSLWEITPMPSQDMVQRDAKSDVLSVPASSSSMGMLPQQLLVPSGRLSKAPGGHRPLKPFYGVDYGTSKLSPLTATPPYESPSARRESPLLARSGMAKAPGSERLPKQTFHGVAQGEPAVVGMAAIP